MAELESLGSVHCKQANGIRGCGGQGDGPFGLRKVVEVVKKFTCDASFDDRLGLPHLDKLQKSGSSRRVGESKMPDHEPCGVNGMDSFLLHLFMRLVDARENPRTVRDSAQHFADIQF